MERETQRMQEGEGKTRETVLQREFKLDLLYSLASPITSADLYSDPGSEIGH